MAEKIEETMALRGMNQDRLAEKSGIAVSSISRYISGKVVPSAVVLKKLAEALDVNVSYLMGEKQIYKPVRSTKDILKMIEEYSHHFTDEEKLNLIKKISDLNGKNSV